MSTATLNGLRNYLYDTLSPANLIWLGTQLAEYGRRQEQLLKPNTKDEMVAKIELSEQQLAERKYQDFDEAFEVQDFPDMDKELYSPEEAYELTMKDIKAIYAKEDAV